jgi:hypothetical protein
MIESADSKGNFLTAENGNICLHTKDSKSVQVWNLTISENWVKFQGIPPGGKEGKLIGISKAASALVYGDGILEDFQLENGTNDTFRVTFEYYELGLYWYTDGNSISFTDNQTYAAKWKLTKCCE